MTQSANALSSVTAKPLPEWNLADLYPGMDDPSVLADKAALDTQGKEFSQSYKGKLSDHAANDPAKLAKGVKTFEAIQDRLGRLMAFAYLNYAGNTVDPGRAKFYGDMQGFVTMIATDLLFFELEINRIDDSVLEKALRANKDLSHYAPWFNDLRLERPHQLDDRLEQLFLEKSVTGSSAWNRLFDETMASLRFDVGGEQLGLEAVLNLLLDKNEAKRRAAFEALAVVFKQELRIFTLITNTLAKDKDISDQWRNFTDIADSRHLANRVEREVVDALVATVRDYYPRLSHRYYALKAKWFGKDQLESWDRNAPLPTVELKEFAWDDARDTVLKSFGRFAPEMAEIAKRFFDGGWIDAPVRAGKAPGAFAHPTVPSAHPYVLLNYQGKPRDVMTLAHELGHGVHQIMAASNGALMAPTPLTLAETASVFGEMLTFRTLLSTTTDKAQRKAMLASKVEDMINTVVRQIAFYSFERKVHEARKLGELTGEQLGQIWLSVQGESLGPAVNIAEGYENFWVYIPHFIHSPFYVYAYAFGDCLVNSLYALYEKSHPDFVSKYFALLSAGGSKHYSELLAPFGLDPKRGDFWKLGLELLDSMITELESM